MRFEPNWTTPTLMFLSVKKITSPGIKKFFLVIAEPELV